MTTVGGYVFATVNNNAFKTTREQQIFWTGAKYETGPWAFTAAYYHQTQNDWTNQAGTCAANTATNKANKGFIGNTTASNCAGDLNQVSFIADYTFNKHFDVYTGVNFGEVTGGQASGFVNDNQTTVMTGARLKF